MGQNFCNEPLFIDAIQDYYYFIDRGYPEKGCLKLVGDRYKLSGSDRTMLYRGITSEENNIQRLNRLTNNLENRELIIDGYNVLFTIMNYKLGRSVFISTDGFCRDSGSLFGKIRKTGDFIDALEQTIKFLAGQKPEWITIVYDTPVSFSREHAYHTRTLLEDNLIPGEVKLERHADKLLINAETGILCTSDSGIMNQTTLPLADIPRRVIEYFYSPDFYNLNEILMP